MSAAELFAGAGQSPGVEIWRIEAMKPVKQTDVTSGKFFSGDSYIVLHTFTERTGQIAMNAHFWLGSESSQDERGAAALLTVELDQFLGDLPTQFRECQGAESTEFLQLFKNGVRYLEGGVDSAFNKVDRDAHVTTLLHVKGNRSVRVMSAPLALDSLNSGDVFILDLGKALIQFNGSGASRRERSKALDVLLAVRDEERGGKCGVLSIDEGDERDVDGVNDFFAALGVDPAEPIPRIRSAEEGGADDDVDATAAGTIQLHRCTVPEEGEGGGTAGAAGVLTSELVGPGADGKGLTKDLLATDGVYVLISGGCAYAWVGKGAGATERKCAMRWGMELARDAGLSPNAPVKIVKEGTEPPLFKQAFQRWSAPVAGAGAPTKPARAPRTKKSVDVAAMAAGTPGRDKDRGRAFDDGAGGTLKIWRIEKFEKVPVDPEQHGVFHAGDSYIVQYTYGDESGRPKNHVIYFWQGRDSTADEKGASALLATALSDSLGGNVPQIRVAMGKEPDHFYSLFGGKMVVRAGGVEGGFNRTEAGFGTEGTDEGNEGVALFHVRGTDDVNTRAVQVAADASALNSGDCFVLVLDRKTAAGGGIDGEARVFAWNGRGSSEDEKVCAHKVASCVLAPAVGLVSNDVEVIDEGAEPDIFWAPIGGKKPYAEFGEGYDVPQEPRLFQICDAVVGGAGVACEEIFNFCQDDLCDDDVMLLDVTNEVFLWCGLGANENERVEARTLAAAYVAACAERDGRDPECPVNEIRSGAEPPAFTCHFIGWDGSKGLGRGGPGGGFVDPYEAKLAAARADAKENARPPPAFASPALKKVTTRATDEEANGETGETGAASGTFEMPKLRATPAKPAAAHAGGEGSRDGVGSSSAPSATPGVPSEASGVAPVDKPAGSATFSRAELAAMDSSSGIDMERKESYLADGEFVEVFGMERGAFESMPLWKRQAAKKKAGLF